MSHYHELSELQYICSRTLQSMIGKPVMLAPQQDPLVQPGQPHILVRVGILGPALGGQCIIEMPLLTALNLSALSLSSQNFAMINNEQNPTYEDWRKRILGLPTSGSAQQYQCIDDWVKTIEVNLGAFHNDEKMKVGVVDTPDPTQPYGKVRVKIGNGKYKTYPLSAKRQATIELDLANAIVTVLNTSTISVDFDESSQTLGPVPPQRKDFHVVTQINDKAYLVKAGSSFVKSHLLELANQLAPMMIPAHLTGDISTPHVIPAKLRHLPLPDITIYEVRLVVMGLGPLQVRLELCDIADLNTSQLNVLKSLFNFTFYHPELKKIFGS